MSMQEDINGSEGAENEVQNWLQVALAKENLQDLSIDIGGNSEKGDGYVGDIIFLTATGTNNLNEKKSYNLVLKCSKRSAALMETIPIREAFLLEIYMYEEVFPTFRKFQIGKGIKKPFDSVPKCYGTYSDGLRYVIVLENLKKMGYAQWEMDKPLTRRHIDLIIKEYAQFHAISVAMREQEPTDFQKLINGIENDIFRKFCEAVDIVATYMKVIEEVATLLKDDLSDDVLSKWLSFKDQIHFLCFEMEMVLEEQDLRVITHSDCWTNNFLHKYVDKSSVPSKVGMLDWQFCKYFSPVWDLSYFLFACLAEQDFTDVDTILRTYHKTFCESLTQMGSVFPEKYPFEKLLEEWKRYSRFGLMVCLLPIKGAFSSKEDLPDMAKSAENSDDFRSTFIFETKNKTGWKNRMRPLVEYVVADGLI